MKFSVCKKILLLFFLCLLPLCLAGPRLALPHTLAHTPDNLGIIVLNYHKIDNMNISLSVTPSDFDRQMKYLKDNHYNIITPDMLYNHLTKGTALPAKPVLITFDDGYEDNYKNAYPILKKYGFTATIFVVTGLVGKYPNYLTWAQCRELKKEGFFIESHTVSHKSLTELTSEQIKAEVVQSKKTLDEKLHQNTYYFAYPTGTYNLYIAQILKDAGYRGAFTIKYGTVDNSSNLFALERVPVFHTGNTFHSFYQRLLYLPVFEKLGWVKG